MFLINRDEDRGTYKVGFLNGSKKRPDQNDAKLAGWITDNQKVKS